MNYPTERIRDKPKLTDRQRIDLLLDQLAWERHLRELCEHAIDLQRDQLDTLAMAVARLEGHRDPKRARRNHLGEK